jgi:hypothetical protein
MGRILSVYKQCSIGPRNFATGKQTLAMNGCQGDPTKRKFPVTRTIIEENPYLSRKKNAQTLSLHHDVVLDGLKKKLTENPNPNPEKGHFCIWIIPDPVWPIMKSKKIISLGCSIQLAAQIWAGRLLASWASERHARREFIRNDRGAAKKVVGILMPIQISTVRAVFE